MVGTPARRSARIIAVVAAAAVMMPLLPAHAADGVRTTRAFEISGSAAGRHLAWTQATRRRPNHYNAMFKPGGGTARRLNARGTQGFTTGGAIDEDRSTLAYWQRVHRRADIKLYDISSGRRHSAPGAVNTRRHEWGAAVSDRWLLFARGSYGSRMKIFLFNRATGNLRRLARGSSTTYLQPGDVTGRFATYTRCRNDFAGCRDYRYNSRTGNTQALRNPLGRHQFASSVTANGAVYFAESRHIQRCNSRLKIWRQSASGNRKRLTTLAEGTSIGTTSVRRLSRSRVAVYYDRSYCSRFVSDIYRIRVRG